MKKNSKNQNKQQYQQINNEPSMDQIMHVFLIENDCLQRTQNNMDIYNDILFSHPNLSERLQEEGDLFSIVKENATMFCIAYNNDKFMKTKQNKELYANYSRVFGFTSYDLGEVENTLIEISKSNLYNGLSNGFRYGTIVHSDPIIRKVSSINPMSNQFLKEAALQFCVDLNLNPKLAVGARRDVYNELINNGIVTNKDIDNYMTSLKNTNTFSKNNNINK